MLFEGGDVHLTMVATHYRGLKIMFRMNLRKYSTPSGKLLDWTSVWTLSGDFVICSECKSIQTIRHAATPFQHQTGCTNAQISSSPWRDLRNILVSLPSTPD